MGHLQIDTLPTQKLELTYHELSCSRLERQIFNFLSKLAVRLMNLNANFLKKSQISFTVVNIKHQNGLRLLCSTMLGNTGQEVAILHLCAMYRNSSFVFALPMSMLQCNKKAWTM